jgi:CheY-like chemotaxis protein
MADGVRPFLIALTAGAMREDRERCIAAGMDAYLSKPLSMQDLQTSLENCYAQLAGKPPAEELELVPIQ